MSEREREGLSNSSSVFKDNRKVWGSISFRGIFALPPSAPSPAVLMFDLCRAPPSFQSFRTVGLSQPVGKDFELPADLLAPTDNRVFLLDKIESHRPLVGRGLRGEGGEPKERIGGKRGHCAAAAAARLSPTMATSAAPPPLPRFISPGDRRNKFSGLTALLVLCPMRLPWIQELSPTVISLAPKK